MNGSPASLSHERTIRRAVQAQVSPSLVGRGAGRYEPIPQTLDDGGQFRGQVEAPRGIIIGALGVHWSLGLTLLMMPPNSVREQEPRAAAM